MVWIPQAPIIKDGIIANTTSNAPLKTVCRLKQNFTKRVRIRHIILIPITVSSSYARIEIYKENPSDYHLTLAQGIISRQSTRILKELRNDIPFIHDGTYEFEIRAIILNHWGSAISINMIIYYDVWEDEINE